MPNQILRLQPVLLLLLIVFISCASWINFHSFCFWQLEKHHRDRRNGAHALAKTSFIYSWCEWHDMLNVGSVELEGVEQSVQSFHADNQVIFSLIGLVMIGERCLRNLDNFHLVYLWLGLNKVVSYSIVFTNTPDTMNTWGSWIWSADWNNFSENDPHSREHYLSSKEGKILKV